MQMYSKQLPWSCGILSLALCCSSSGFAAGQTLYFFDPDANQDVILVTIASWNAVLAANNVDAVFQPLQSEQSLRSVEGVRYAIISSRYQHLWKELDLEPVLVPEQQGSVFFRKVLVSVKPIVGKDLGQLVVAAAVTPEDSYQVTDLLQRKGYDASAVYVMSVSKDIDAIFAMTFGDAEAALVTQDSIDTLKRVNPVVARRLQVVMETDDIMRASLCISKEVLGNSGAEGGATDAVVDFFARMHQDEAGVRLLRLSSISRWVKIKKGMLK